VEGGHFAQQNAGVVPALTTPPLRGTPPKEGNYYWLAAPSAAIVIALGFVAIAIPLEFRAMWITIGWLAVFGGLWYFGNRQKDNTFLVMAVIFFGLGMFRFMGELRDQLGQAKTLLDITPVFNVIALPMLACMGVLMLAAVLASRFIPKDVNREHNVVYWAFNHAIGILGYVLLGIVLSGEAARYFYGHTEIWQPYSAAYLLSAFLLGFWFILPVVLLEIGFLFRSKVIVSVTSVALAFAIIAMLLMGFAFRCQYREAFDNPFAIILIAESIILLVLSSRVAIVRLQDSQSYDCGSDNQKILAGFGIVGLFSLLAILTIEWVKYF
jgi:hypothetical protein